MSEAVLTKRDVDALGNKLEKFADGLPEQEKNVLNWLMARARQASSTTEISEDDLDAVSGGLAEALDMAAEDEIKVTVSWSK